MRVLLLGKQREDHYFQKVVEFLQRNITDLDISLALPGESFPDPLLSWQGDFIISYLCPWVFPEDFLRSAKKAAINFHPGPPEYPGTGCTNFAIYHQVTEYGVTCHHMSPRVDSGTIISVKRFKVLPSDTVFTLTQRCYAHMLVLFYDIITGIFHGEPLPQTDEQWKRKPYKRSQLNELKRIEITMSDEEIKRRILASAYPCTPGAFVEIAGEVFEHKPKA